MSQPDGVSDQIRGFILQQFLEGEDPAALTDEVPLITAGIIDSIGTIRLIAFLEETFGVSVGAHEADVEHLNTIGDITRLVESKRAGR